jgi:hypothetical protein
MATRDHHSIRLNLRLPRSLELIQRIVSKSYGPSKGSPPCSSPLRRRKAIRRDVKDPKPQGIDVPTCKTLQDIGLGTTQKSKVAKLWLEG